MAFRCKPGGPFVFRGQAEGDNLAKMEIGSAGYANLLRREIAERNREYARGRVHVESYGGDPVVVYGPDHPTDKEPRVGTPRPQLSEDGVERHGNFYNEAYRAIRARPEWAKRFSKVHTGGRKLPKPEDPKRKWRELDSCMSSDALLMNFFCTPGVAEAPAVRRMLGIDAGEGPVFGWKARVPLKSGLFDRTEVDLRLSDLLVEAKLTEGDFQTRSAKIVEGYRDFEAVFDRELLPRVEVTLARRKHAVEFAEEFTQEWEDTSALAPDEAGAIAGEFHAGLVAEAVERAPREVRYRSYQLIRNVLAAHASGARFCVICDERRPDLREAWFRVMAAVRSAEMRTRCLMLTWQELAAVAPVGLREFLEVKYGIVAG
jgi:hypothetical protein